MGRIPVYGQKLNQDPTYLQQHCMAPAVSAFTLEFRMSFPTD